jgi:subtilisin family serine protease
VVLVAAAGNNDDCTVLVEAPARIPGVVAVSGTDRDANFWNGSVVGREVVISAPAVDIFGPAPLKFSPSGFGIGSGTSSATAIMSGAAALIRSRYPKLNAASVIERLIRTAKDQGPVGRDDKFGFGTVRPFNALTEDVAPVAKNPLGEPPASSVSAGSTTAEGRRYGGTRTVVLPILYALGGVVLLVVLVVVIVLLSRRRRPPRPPGYPPRSPGPPPSGYPSAPGQPSGGPVRPGRPSG